MQDSNRSFLDRQFLRSLWDLDFQAFKDSDEEKALNERLRRWSERADLGENSAISAFFEQFFEKTWGYVQSGQSGSEHSFSLYPQFAVAGGGSGGGAGTADAALGYFKSSQSNYVPQVLCEFKGIKSALDAPQKRKGNTRSPVRQGLDYLGASRRAMFGHEPILPMWAIVSDMNEFRLYWYERGDRQFIAFKITSSDLFSGVTLLDKSEDARFERFLFARLFHRDTLTVQTDSGRPLLHQIIKQQRFRQRELENTFYEEYRAYRQYLYEVLYEFNDENSGRFPGTRGRLVRLAQKIIDRAIFIFFCEDMGRVLGFPPQLLRDFLANRADDQYFDPLRDNIWRDLLSLFTAMNDGTAFGGQQLNQFNGGLFAPDPELEQLWIPNYIFCQQGQGQNEASLHDNKLTLLYLSAAYNYAAGWSDSLTQARPAGSPAPVDAAKRDPQRSLGLYTLGRIFEQSITELEILEAEADERASLNKTNKRKRDGVYYTPEWVVERIVAETLGRRLADLKTHCGWPDAGSQKLPSEPAINAYESELRRIKIVDPACGSGAFLITALRYLLDEWNALQSVRRQVTGDIKTREGFEDAVVRDVLRQNLYGVDINPASVEITKLALWLHTARGDRPLSSLDDHIRDGNSLIGPDFFEGLAPYHAEERERINAFDWQAAFPEVFQRGGFDAVIGNPPYVKLQNFRRVHPDMAAFLSRDLGAGGHYRSTQTGNFDIFLPFIEKGINLLNDDGRLGYIAPSLWTMNEYGAGLRELVHEGGHLWGWIDFGSYQVFDEAITYTALQFYSARPNDTVSVSPAPDGVIPADAWVGNYKSLPYPQLAFGDRWLMVTGADRDLIDKIYRRSRRLNHPEVSSNIFVGIQTSADEVYHLDRIGPGRYQCTPRGQNAPPPYEVPIEDDIMKPLVSGSEAKRYEEPNINTYLLFPYSADPDRVRIIPENTLRQNYHKAWRFLKSWETELRKREQHRFDDDRWFRFGRHQNLDKQNTPKIVVAQTTPELRLFSDHEAKYFLNNVRVNGISPKKADRIFELLGILNGPVCNFVFKKIAKPKDGGYFEANRQFISPLPVPQTARNDSERIGVFASRLQEMHTRRRRAIDDIARRRSVLRTSVRSESWLFPNIPSVEQLEERAPKRFDRAQKDEWIAKERNEAVDRHHTELGANLRPGVVMDAELVNGELRFFVDGMRVIDRVFVTDEEGPFIAAQWKLIATTFSVTPNTDGKKLSKALRTLAVKDNQAAADQIIDLQHDLEATEREIVRLEGDLNALLYELYGLDETDIRRIERSV